MKKPKPKKVPFKDLPIDVWSPTEKGQPYIAMFRGLPMIFKGGSGCEAYLKARKWRVIEMAKEERKMANAKAASERMKSRAKGAVE